MTRSGKAMGCNSNGAERLLTLNHHQATIAAAVFDRLFPADEHSQSATQLGVLSYVDRALGGYDNREVHTYRAGLLGLDRAAQQRFGQPFVSCALHQQDDLLALLEQGRLEDIDGVDQISFFALLQRHMRQGLFADPLHGGNRDKGGWRFLGHPGIWLDSTGDEQMSTEAATRCGEIRSLADIGEEELGVSPSLTEQAAELASASSGQWQDREADVILVGLGAVGGLVAPILTGAGLRVVALEAGSYPTARDYSPDELTWTHYGRGAMGEKFLAELPCWRANPTEPVRPAPISLGRMVNGVGGSVIRYAGWLRRYHPYHFHHLQYIQERWGSGILPPGATLADWPLSYDDLEPYYNRVEQTVGVAGDGDNPFIPRSEPLPMPALRPFHAGEEFRRACSERGLHPFVAPAGINSVPYNGLPATRYSAWSAGAGFGPFASDRWNPGLTAVPDALRSGLLDLRTRCRVVSVVTGRDGRASGVEYVDSAGEHRVQRGRAVVLSCYTFEAIRLLLLSRDDRHPGGLGNNRAQVGRHFMSKMFGDVHGLIPGRSFNKHTGPAGQAVIVDDFLREGRDYEQLGFVGGATFGCENQFLPLFISQEPPPPDVRPWGKSFKDHLRQWQQQVAVRIQPDALSYRENYIDLDPYRRDRSRWGLPLLRITYDLRDNEQRLATWAENEATQILRAMGATQTWPGPRFTGVISSHDVGGARMGTDASDSVVNADLEVHDTPGLYVFSGAVFPTCPGTNPTLTIWAVCARAAERLGTRLTA